MQNNLPESIKERISKEAQAAADKKVYENGDDAYAGYMDGYEAGLTAAISNPGQWNLAAIVDEYEAIEKVAAAMREADPLFEKIGGSTRHYVRDLLLPILEKSGFAFGKHESPTPSTDTAGLVSALEKILEWVNDSGLKDVALDNKPGMSLYHIKHLATNALKQYNP